MATLINLFHGYLNLFISWLPLSVYFMATLICLFHGYPNLFILVWNQYDALYLQHLFSKMLCSVGNWSVEKNVFNYILAKVNLILTIMY